jgi:hypothetical protein
MKAPVLRTALLSLDFVNRDGSGSGRIFGSSVPAGAAILAYGFDNMALALQWGVGTLWSGRFGFEGLNYSSTFDTGLLVDQRREYRHAYKSGIRLPVAARAWFEWRNIDLTGPVLLDVRGRWWINYIG